MIAEPRCDIHSYCYNPIDRNIMNNGLMSRTILNSKNYPRRFLQVHLFNVAINHKPYTVHY